MPSAMMPALQGAQNDGLSASAGDGCRLEPEHEAFCQSGVTTVAAAALADEMPIACLAHGCRILPNGVVRLLLPADGGAEVLALVGRGAAVAATFSESPSHRSIQIKGTGARIVETIGEDIAEARRQQEALARKISQLGFPAAYVEAFCHVDQAGVAVVEFHLGCAFTQTPGPGAGAALT